MTKVKFKFLGLGGKPDAKLRKMWDLAQIILKTVVKLKTGVAEVIIKQLSKRIMYSKAAPRYTDTGYSLPDKHILTPINPVVMTAYVIFTKNDTHCSEFQNDLCKSNKLSRCILD